MTDPRYLVPLASLPPVSGAPTAYLCTECGAAWTGEPTCSAYNPDTATVVTCLDLSRPAERDGVPVRLDALEWALAVLHPQASHARKGAGGGVLELYSNTGSNIAPVAYVLSCTLNIYKHEIVVRPWPDLAGLTGDAAVRAIVAAALRNSHVQKVSP